MKKINFGKNNEESEIFFEEYEILKKKLKSIKNEKFFRILDLGCGNGRFNLLIKKIFQEIFEEEKGENKKNKKNKNGKIFYGVEKNFSENLKNFSDVFINTDIENFLKNRKEIIGEKFFDFVILSGIFENFLKFDEKILNKIYGILNNDGFVFVNFWNYGENFFENFGNIEKNNLKNSLKNIFREKDKNLVKEYFEENILPKIKKSKFGENFEVFFNEKQKNGGWNISLILGR